MKSVSACSEATGIRHAGEVAFFATQPARLMTRASRRWSLDSFQSSKNYTCFSLNEKVHLSASGPFFVLCSIIQDILDVFLVVVGHLLYCRNGIYPQARLLNLTVLQFHQ